jgi:hypothetical protein
LNPIPASADESETPLAGTVLHMGMRSLVVGVLMLCIGVAFTWGLASTLEARGDRPSAALHADPSVPSVAAGKRKESDWQF